MSEGDFDGISRFGWYVTSFRNGCGADATLQDYKNMDGIKAEANLNAVG